MVLHYITLQIIYSKLIFCLLIVSAVLLYTAGWFHLQQRSSSCVFLLFFDQQHQTEPSIISCQKYSNQDWITNWAKWALKAPWSMCVNWFVILSHIYKNKIKNTTEALYQLTWRAPLCKSLVLKSSLFIMLINGVLFKLSKPGVRLSISFLPWGTLTDKSIRDSYNCWLSDSKTINHIGEMCVKGFEWQKGRYIVDNTLSIPAVWT